jgi:hypothetical protein
MMAMRSPMRYRVDDGDAIRDAMSRGRWQCDPRCDAAWMMAMRSATGCRVGDGNAIRDGMPRG